MPRSNTRRKKPTAAELATVVNILDQIAPPDVYRDIRRTVFPRNTEIIASIAKSRDTISRARDMHTHAIMRKHQGDPYWAGTWNPMIGNLNIARDQLVTAVKHASAKEHANMLKGNKRQFSKKSLDWAFTPRQSRAFVGAPHYNPGTFVWPVQYLDTLQERSEELAALTGIPEEDIGWSRASDWSENLGGKLQRTKKAKKCKHRTRQPARRQTRRR